MRWQIGQVRITRIQELELPGLTWLLPDATAESLAGIDWIGPFVDAKGEGLASVHALLIEAPGCTVVVDTCIGNDKERSIRGWNHLQTKFLEDFDTAGAGVGAVDAVVCTHLHVDHVGWNTRLVDDRWVPTFENARYLFGRVEWEHWNVDEDEIQQQVMIDSVRPIFDSDQVDLVETDHQICNEVRLEPTPGHTPGHVSVHISSCGEQAVITGDLMHHPGQIAHPEWCSNADSDRARALDTRRGFLARYAETPTLVIGTHFAGPTAGRLARDGDTYRFDV
ncbi:MAG: MBL fold metallo-hydrolase [bacterium]|nr:MBL fold metallo-hydrolase [bacterium]